MKETTTRTNGLAWFVELTTKKVWQHTLTNEEGRATAAESRTNEFHPEKNWKKRAYEQGETHRASTEAKEERRIDALAVVIAPPESAL